MTSFFRLWQKQLPKITCKPLGNTPTQREMRRIRVCCWFNINLFMRISSEKVLYEWQLKWSRASPESGCASQVLQRLACTCVRMRVPRYSIKYASSL